MDDKPTPRQIADLQSAFEPFSAQENSEDWAKEYRIAVSFARDFDLYRAITSFKRAKVLLPEGHPRLQQLQYATILGYYLGHKFPEVVIEFEASELVTAKPDFPAFYNLLLILTDTYNRMGDSAYSEKLRTLLERYYPETLEKLETSRAIRLGQIEELEARAGNHPLIRDNLDTYYARRKSPRTAKTLQAILPGAGYYYVGLKKAAVTSFIINALFAWATYKLIDDDHIAGGIIVGSLEAGWYLGGINGAAMEATEYNERTYEPLAGRMLREGRLYPAMMFQTVF